MSYKVKNKSLAEQIDNLADVYSRVETLPLARSAIRKQAREGLLVPEGSSAVEVAGLVDSVVGVFGEPTTRLDPRTSSTTVGWWKQPATYLNKGLKQAFRLAHARRSLKLTPTLSVNQPFAGEAAFFHIDSELFYADGKSVVGSWQASITQSIWQATNLGVSIPVAVSVSSITPNPQFIVRVNPPSSVLIPGWSYDDLDPLFLQFDLIIQARENPRDRDSGAYVSGASGSKTTLRAKLGVWTNQKIS